MVNDIYFWSWSRECYVPKPYDPCFVVADFIRVAVFLQFRLLSSIFSRLPSPLFLSRLLVSSVARRLGFCLAEIAVVMIPNINYDIVQVVDYEPEHKGHITSY